MSSYQVNLLQVKGQEFDRCPRLGFFPLFMVVSYLINSLFTSKIYAVKAMLAMREDLRGFLFSCMHVILFL